MILARYFNCNFAETELRHLIEFLQKELKLKTVNSFEISTSRDYVRGYSIGGVYTQFDNNTDKGTAPGVTLRSASELSESLPSVTQNKGRQVSNPRSLILFFSASLKIEILNLFFSVFWLFSGQTFAIIFHRPNPTVSF